MVGPAKNPRALQVITAIELVELALELFFLVLVFILTEVVSFFLSMAWLNTSGILKSMSADKVTN